MTPTAHHPDWQIVKLGDILDIERGGSPRPIQKYLTDREDGINWVKIGDTKNVHKYIEHTKQKIIPEGLKKSRLVKAGDFLLSNSMSFGRPYIMKTTGAIHDGWLVLRPKEKNIDQDFLYLLLGSPLVFKQFDSLAAGSTVRNLNISLVKSVKIPLPPLLEQKQIVKILDETFVAAERAREIAEQNLASAKELFESYLQSAFAGNGDNGSWEEKELGEIANVEYGFTDKAKSVGDFRFIRITDIDKHGNLEAENKMYVKYSKEAEKFSLEDGELLMARTGATFGKVLLYKNLEKSIFASYLIRIKFTEKILNKLYWYFSKSQLYWDQANQFASGSAQPQFNGGALKQITFRFPKSLKTQKQIVARLDLLSTETKKLESVYRQKLDNLDELKKSILKKAFAGKL